VDTVMPYFFPYETEFVVIIVLVIVGLLIAKRIIRKRQKPV
jgi:hypothetical protein